MERTLEGRLQSFSKSKGSKPTSSKASSSLVWPHPNTYAANPQTLAEAGFYFSPDKDDIDNVRCFMCEKELGGWDKDDNPFEIHINKSPKCPWAVARCSLEFDVDQNGNFSIKSPTRLPMNKLLEKARLDTYGGKQKWWPHDSAKSHGATSKKMAKAGFVYTPQVPGDDTATCFYCDLSLSGWDEDDDPAEEHRKREERSGKPCPFFHAKVQIGPSGSKGAASRKSKAAPRQNETATEDSEVEKLAPAPAKKGKQKSTVNGSMPPPSTTSSTSRKKGAKTYTSHDEESQDDHDEGSAASKPSRKGGKSKSTVKSKTPLELVSEVEEEEEAPLPGPPRSKTPASKKAPAADKPPSNVNGKVAKKQQPQQYTDVTIGLNDEEEREGRSKDKGLSRSTSTRSKSKPRSTAKPSSSRSRSHSRAASRSKTTDIEDEDELTAEPDPEPEIEAEPAPAPKPKARRQTKAKPTATIEQSDVEDVPAPKPKSKRQTKTAATKKATESESEDALFIVKSTKPKPKPQKKPPSTALDAPAAREASEKPPSVAAMDVDGDEDGQQPVLRASVPPSSKKRTTTTKKKGGGSKTSSLSSSTSSAESGRGAQREREPTEAEERLETLQEEEVYDDAGMQVDFEEPAPAPEEPPAPKPVKKKAETKPKPKPKPKRMELEEIAETDESAPPTRPASAASLREATTTTTIAANAVAPPPSAAQEKAKPTTNGKTKVGNTVLEPLEPPQPPQPLAKESMGVDAPPNANAKKKPRAQADASVPVLQPAAKIRVDKTGYGAGAGYRPATPERRPPPKVALTLTSPPASPTRSPLKASFLLPAVSVPEPTPPAPAPASIPTPLTPPPLTENDAASPPPASPPASPPAAANSNTAANSNSNTDSTTAPSSTNPPNPLALFLPPLASAPLALAQALTDAERSLTVEQWIRHEMDVQYAALQRDGEARIAAFRAAAEEVRRQIEAL